MGSEQARERIAKLVYLIAGCGVPDELDSEWENCGENWQQNCLEIADQILSLTWPNGQPVLTILPPDSAILQNISLFKDLSSED